MTCAGDRVTIDNESFVWELVTLPGNLELLVRHEHWPQRLEAFFNATPGGETLPARSAEFVGSPEVVEQVIRGALDAGWGPEGEAGSLRFNGDDFLPLAVEN